MVKKYLKKYKTTLAMIIIITSFQALLTLSLPDYLSNIISNGIALGDIKYVWTTGFKMLLVTLASGVLAIIINFIASRFGADLARNIREEVFSKIIHFDTTNFSDFETSSLITRTTNDITQIQTVFTLFFRMITFAVILGIGGTIKAISKSAGISTLGIIVCIGIALVIIMLILLYIFVLPKYNKLQILLDKMNGKTRESLNGLLVIRAFNKEKEEKTKFKNINKDYTSLELFLNRMMSFLSPYINLILNGISIAIVWVIAQKATEMSAIGNMLAFSQYAVQILSSFITLSVIFVLLPRASVSYQRINEVLKSDNTLKQSNVPISPKQIKGEITFKSVSYYYPKSNTPILENISFSIKPGQTFAIIGSTGSGKSTLIKLISHLYDATQGDILIDGEDIYSYNEQTLRTHIGVIPQKPFLFKGTIKENIKDGLKNASDKEIKEALKIACATFVKDLDAPVASKGENFSGGERQRLTIARAVIKKPAILILDDCLSALDFKTDATIRTNLKKALPNTTFIVIASRIGTIKNANQIMVLNEGKMVGLGTHQELIKNCSIYQEIAHSQLGSEALK